jgi:hypothetical protein
METICIERSLYGTCEAWAHAQVFAPIAVSSSLKYNQKLGMSKER